ncbi:site-specific DNA-methyltransferase [Vibrio parahaemolyticus]|uniref:DNA-methyltransferase n=1 Tax=Vibrio parahaemolyticus TaxID=670 RepID=UPI001EEB9DDE|nr:site-specific DNA-methyltransferase [Vibrio parahaemolyticus]MCG6424290.1 site-specific DNA-methyltransferase [Vibrio parahaemolyticus]
MTQKKLEPRKNITVFNADCSQLLKTLPDNSVDLIATDPPYFRVKQDAWDNQWDDEAEFLAWLDDILFDLWRVLKPSGSLYLFCSDRLAARTEVLIAERFNVLNHIVWRKENGVHKRHRKEGLRRFCPQTERIIFAEHYGAEGFAKGRAGYAEKCRELKAQVFEPLIAYFREAKERAGVSSKAVNEATSTQMCSHWFTSSQWKLPTREQYEALQRLFSDHADGLNKDHQQLTEEYGQLHRTYVELRRDYDDLRVQYEQLRRPFGVTADVPYTDVWDFDPVQYYPGKHPCEKPLPLMRHIVSTSAREGMVVLDPFMGSGATAKACIELGCHFVGVEMDDDIFSATAKSLAEHKTEEEQKDI